MRNYSGKKYIKLVENNPLLKEFVDKEIELINQIENSKNKTFIDLGAGSGRMTPFLSKIAKKVISIEINPKMLPELKMRAYSFKNVEVIEGNIAKLSNLLNGKVINQCVLLLLQNTISVFEKAEDNKILEKMRKVAKENNGEIIISFCRAEALKNWGMKLYFSIKEMIGEPDLEKIDFGKGLFVSKTSYISKWRNKKEIEEIKNFFEGKILHEIWTDNFCILHIGFS